MTVARQSTARTFIVGPVLDADGVAVTDLAVGDFLISKDGGNGGALNGSATLTHRHTGHYSLALTATDTNTVGETVVYLNDGTNACAPLRLTVIEEAAYDAMYAASAPGPLPANSNGSGLTEAGGTGDHLTAVPWNAAWDAEVQSECADALNAYDPPTNAEMEARTLAAANYATASALATVDGNVGAILEDTGTTLPGALSTIAGYLDTEIAAIMAVTDKLDDTLEDAGGGSYVFTEAALANAPAGEGGGGGATAEEIWEYATRTLTANPGLDAAGVRSAVGLSSANLDTQLGAIVEDTGTTLPAQIGALNNLSAAEVNAEVDTALADAGLTTTVTGRIDAAISTRASQATAEAIEADTQNIQGRIPDALVSGSIKANITHVIGDAVQESGATDTNWGGTP